MRRIAILLCAALVIRLIVVVVLTNGGFVPGFVPGWGGEMASVAQSVAIGEGFSSPYFEPTGPTALVPPVYPYIESLFFQIFGVHAVAAGIALLGFNILISAAVCIPLFIFVKKLSGDRIASLASWAWALFPLTGYTEAMYIWNTSLYVLVLMSFLALLVSLHNQSSLRTWSIFGGLTGMQILVEPVALAIVLPCYVWLLCGKFSLRMVAFSALIAITPATLWTARNYAVFGQYVFLRSGFGLQLICGAKDGVPYTACMPGRNLAELKRYKEMGELEYFHALQDEAISIIKTDPQGFLTRSTNNVVAFWTGREEASSLFWFPGRFSVLKTILYTLPAVGAFLGLMALFKQNRSIALLLGSIFIAYPIVYYVTFTSPRMAAPLLPIMLALCAIALQSITRPAFDRLNVELARAPAALSRPRPRR